jgi:hypothetical protein
MPRSWRVFFFVIPFYFLHAHGLVVGGLQELTEAPFFFYFSSFFYHRHAEIARAE